MTGGRLSIKPPAPLPPPTAEEVLARLAGNVKPIPRSEAAKKGVEPHDWRWFVGGLGRVLISLGLLIFAFVGYQLWGTGIQYRAHQDELSKQFEELLASAPAAPAPAVELEVVDSTATASEDGEPPTSNPVEGTETTEAPVAVTPLPLPTIQLGDPLAFLTIPKLGMEGSILVAGVRTSDLEKGVGHFADTPLPGQPGNAAIAGHRTTHGAPFGNLDRLTNGDRVVVDTLQGHYEYTVVGTVVVPPSDYSVVANVADRNLLTLITCHPKYTARERLVVTAELDPAASSPLAVAQINYGRDPADLASGDDGLAGEATDATGPADAGVLPETADTGAETGVDTSVDAGAATDPATADSVAVTPESIPAEGTATTEPAGASGAPSGEDGEFAGQSDETVDAFAAGWFSDPDAWPQVAYWGFACTGVSLLAWLLGRKTRNWFSALVGIGPFVVVLYFFFENVNRLLPPNL